MIPTLIYDAHCNLCRSTQTWLARWGKNREIRFLHFEDTQACALQPDLCGLDHLSAFRFIDQEGKTWEGAQAVIHLLRILPFGRPMAWVFSFPGMDRLAASIYAWVARNRYWILGRT